MHFLLYNYYKKINRNTNIVTLIYILHIVVYYTVLKMSILSKLIISFNYIHIHKC